MSDYDSGAVELTQALRPDRVLALLDCANRPLETPAPVLQPPQPPDES